MSLLQETKTIIATWLQRQKHTLSDRSIPAVAIWPFLLYTYRTRTSPAEESMGMCVAECVEHGAETDTGRQWANSVSLSTPRHCHRVHSDTTDSVRIIFGLALGASTMSCTWYAPRLVPGLLRVLLWVTQPEPNQGAGQPRSYVGPQDVTGIIGVLINSGFCTRKHFCKNDAKFGHAPSKMFASPR